MDTTPTPAADATVQLPSASPAEQLRQLAAWLDANLTPGEQRILAELRDECGAAVERAVGKLGPMLLPRLMQVIGTVAG